MSTQTPAYVPISPTTQIQTPVSTGMHRRAQHKFCVSYKAKNTYLDIMEVDLLESPWVGVYQVEIQGVARQEDHYNLSTKWHQ